MDKNLLREIGNYAYFIVDPFNHTYNPAKNILIDDERHDLYPAVFDQALRAILLNGPKPE